MTTTEVARRFGAREIAKGWIARCPAHADGRPSLSINEGRSGQTLLFCHAGCRVQDVVSSVGLTIGDLFPTNSLRPTQTTRAAIEDAQGALDNELRLLLDREEERIGFRPTPITRLKNRAREVVERRYGVKLSRHVSPWWEVPPFCEDPLWTLCIERALEESACRSGVETDWLDKYGKRFPRFAMKVLGRARVILREFARVPA